MVIAVQSRPHEMFAAIRGMGGAVLLKNDLTLVIDAVGLFINHRTQEATGVDAWVRLFRHGKEVPVDPHRIFINPPLIHSRIFSPNAAFEVILWDSVLSIPNAKGWRTRGTVTTVFAGTSDDGIQSNDATYANAAAGTGSTFDLNSTINGEDTAVEISHSSDSGYGISEGFFSFDTSSIADSDSVSAAAFAIKENSGYGSIFTQSDTFEARIYDFGASVTTADWRNPTQFNALTRVATLATSSWATTGYNTFAEDGTNFQTAVNKTGTTYICLLTSRFASNTAPTGIAYAGLMSADNAGTTDDPKLVVTHAAAATAAPVRPTIITQAVNRAAVR